MDESSAYADSAQAREMDRRASGKFDYWGNPIRNLASTFHNYDTEARAAEELAYRKGLKKRIGVAMAQMELVCPPPHPINDGAQQGALGVEMSEAKELAEVPPAETALQVFTADNGLEPWLQKVRIKVDEFNKTLTELTTQKGRDRYASMAHQIAKSKTALEAVGKELSAKQKELPKKIDAERKRVWDMLESWQKEVRKPLDDWQKAEDARIDSHKDSIKWLAGLAEGLGDLESPLISQRIDEAEAFMIGEHLEEFEAESARAKDGALGKLRISLDARLKHEAELAEIARFNAEKAERERVEHEAAIAKAAAEQTQREADQRAQADREAAAGRELQLKLQAEQAERTAAQEKADRLAAEQRAEQDRASAEKRQAEAVEQARLDEVARQQAAADEIVRQEKLREADVEHRRTINRAAIAAFMTNGMTEACAKQAITLIASRQIPAISIAY